MGFNLPVAVGDGPNVDAFGRVRTSDPVTTFECTFLYDLQPLLFQQIVDAGASVTHDPTNVSAVLATNGTGVQTALFQSYEHVRYQPGKSHLIMITFNLNGFTAGATKLVGLGDANNGFFLKLENGLASFVKRSNTSSGNEEVNQSRWNISSFPALRFNMTQILIIDSQWLGVGRVRMGFAVNGQVHYCHEFNHANNLMVPYTRGMVLPIRAYIQSTNVVANMRLICMTVQSEGGVSNEYGYQFSAVGPLVTVASGVDTAILSVRPKLLFNGIPNRAKILIDSIDVFNGGGSPITWALGYGGVFSVAPTWGDLNTAFSQTEISTAPGTLTSIAVGPTFASDLPSGAGAARTAEDQQVRSLYPITLDALGAHRANGTVTVYARGVGGSSANVRAILNLTEVR